MYVSETVKQNFTDRKNACLELFRMANIVNAKIGIFGSYVRDEYKATSDIDFCVITDDRPPRSVVGGLKEDFEINGADIIFVNNDYFNHDPSDFAVQLRRDFKEIVYE